FTEIDAFDTLGQALEIDDDARALLGGIDFARRRASLHLVERLFELAVAGRLFVVLGLEVDDADIRPRLAGRAPARKRDHLAVGRPDRVELRIRMPRQIERLRLLVDRGDPDVSVEV